MKILSTRVLAGILVFAAASGVAMAQKEEAVTVTGSRFVQTKVGINYTGLPIKDVALSYTVDLKDLDLTTSAGVAELDKRVFAAARAACRELGWLYPISHPDTPACIKAAADKTMMQVHQSSIPARPSPTG